MIKDFLKISLTFRRLYLFALLALLVCLPLSKYLASASQLLLALIWLAEGKFPQKWKRIRKRPAIFVFMAVYLIHLLGLIYTGDLAFGIHDLKIKLPLFALPLILGSIEPLNEKELRFILGGFILGIIAGSLVSLSIITGISRIEYLDDRQASLFISHIRFALMTDLAVFLLAYYVFYPHNRQWIRILLIGVALYLTVFLFILKSLTGVVVLVLGGLILAVRYALKSRELLVKWFIIVGVATVPVLAAFYVSDQVGRFYMIREDRSNLDMVTAQGNLYWHDYKNPDMENGYYVGIYQCDPEIKEAWEAVSKMPVDGPDLKGQELKYTLMRYLTSLGLRKDANGISQLKPEDIRLIEKGYASSIYRDQGRFRIKVYETIWQIDHYKKGGNPGGSSVTQRLEFLKTGWAIFLDHPAFGVGTGDLKDSFQAKYVEMQTTLAPEYRLRAHNQFLTFMIAFGSAGFVLILLALILPAIMERRLSSFFVLMFFLVSFLSMFNEDTLETQAGVAFFALFYSLFIFAMDRNIPHQ